MNFGELKTQFTGLLKRRDLTDAQRDFFILQGVARAQKRLRIPPMEKSVEIVLSPSDRGSVTIPSDFLRLKTMAVDADAAELHQRSLGDVLATHTSPGSPRVFARRGAAWVLGPYPDVAGTVVRVDYYAEFTDLKDAADVNYLTNVDPMLVIYGALSFAADQFVDVRQEKFEARFEQLIRETQDQADQDELLNAVVSPTYYFPDE